jgi:transcriptional regulator with PAS, ATPase and Fis domain
MVTALADFRSHGRPLEVERSFGSANETVDTAVSSEEDPLEDVVRTIAEGLDIQQAFSRISEISCRLLAHDGMELVVHDESGRVTLLARSTDDLPAIHHTSVAGPDVFWIVRDSRDLRLQGREQQAWVEQAMASGYRSCLSVRNRTGGQTIQLAFLSKRPATYTPDHVSIVRRIATILVLAASHEQLAETARERSETRVCTAQIDSRARSVARERMPCGRQVIGESPAWRQVLRRATQVAATETTVFLQGESGTGKEVLARFIHRASPRRNGPFVAINCAALPDQLLESELFGYERGAFTGAHQTKPGQIEVAATGVLFLDEVSEMNLAAQAKLLRFVQEREFQRLGGTRPVKADVRVIAASNRDLRRAVADGAFREDLYYRLQVFDIPIPPLRERPEDIPLLAESFLAALGRSMGHQIRLTQASLQKLAGHSWPGNVRELQNALERAAIVSDGQPVEPEHLSLQAPVPTHPGNDLGAVERQKILQVLEQTDGNKAKAARRLGLTRTQLYVRLRRHGLDRLPPLRFSDAT